MKKFIAFPLLALLLYNAFGYYALLVHQSVMHTQALKTSITDADLNVIKIPISLYTHTEDSETEIVDKEMNFDGAVYWVVKQRIVNDTLQIYCLHDYKKESLNAQLADAAQVQHSSIPTAPLKWLLKSFLKEFTVPVTDKNIVRSFRFDKKAAWIASNATRNLRSQCALSLSSPPPNAAV